MYTSSKSLEAASLDDLLEFADTREPTLRQMHALEHLARRSVADHTLLTTIAPMIVKYIDPASRVGGLPVGYPGAAILYRSEGSPRDALLRALAVQPFQRREDLHRWIRGGDDSPDLKSSPTPVERDILVDDSVSAQVLREAVSVVLGRAPEIELLELQRRPFTLALVALTIDEWNILDQNAGQLSSRLHSKLYLWPPDELGGLHPDLRVVVDPSGQRGLVISVSNAEGYVIHPFAPDH